MTRALARSRWVRWWPALLLFALSLGVRLLFWSRMPQEAMTPVDGLLADYTTGLKDHFWEYVFYDHTQPPGMFFIHKLVLQLTGPGRAFVAWSLVPGFLLNSVAVVLVYSMTRWMGAGRALSWAASCIFSLGIIHLELWHSGFSLDRHVVGLVACFAWALMARVKHGGRYDALVAVTGGLLVLMQKAAFLIAPLMIVLTAGLLSAAPAIRWRRTLLALSGPVAVALMLMGKNLLSSGSPWISSLAGANAAQFMWAAQGFDRERLLAFAKQAHAPEWYLWCYDRALTVEPMAPFYGTCYLPDSSVKHVFNFQPLLTHLTDHGETRLARVVAEDEERLATRPYLRTFISQEMSPTFAARYTHVSAQLFRTFIFQQPLKFLIQFTHTNYIYLKDGWGNLLVLLKDRSQSGARLQPWVPWKSALLFSGLLCSVLFLQAYLAAYWLLVRLLRKRRPLSGAEPLALLACLGVVVGSAVVNLACCENGRYFVQVSPYLIPVFAAFARVVVASS